MAFAGVARYPARVKCALLGYKVLQGAVIGPAEGENLLHPGHGAEGVQHR